ncbi:serrate RNA effector molecule-like isoform X2 [Alnus glutinosa]|uniref:serrate RNA effector molecule-like isoform X2 n=1 Tax=Alnus glutinosa TaxID=3517 RepID=UPI002D771373|nr:serrate RNA effector molecule-like isoform X2 [Alnus glutinosa]
MNNAVEQSPNPSANDDTPPPATVLSYRDRRYSQLLRRSPPPFKRSGRRSPCDGGGYEREMGRRPGFIDEKGRFMNRSAEPSGFYFSFFGRTSKAAEIGRFSAAITNYRTLMVQDSPRKCLLMMQA